MKARVIVTLKSGVLDPQGKAIEGALKGLDIGGLKGVRQGKIFDIELEGHDQAAARRRLSARSVAVSRPVSALVAITTWSASMVPAPDVTRKPAPLLAMALSSGSQARRIGFERGSEDENTP